MMGDVTSDVSQKTPTPQTIWEQLWTPCDIASIVFFRIIFAATILWHVGLFFYHNSIEAWFGSPQHHLRFFGFEWIHTFDLTGMRRVYYLMALAAVGVGLGFLYRASAVLLFVTFTYTILADAAGFQNHYYLMSLLAFLLVLIPAQRSLSIDSVIFPKEAGHTIPNWCRWLLMFQLSIPYVFGGIAKLNGDWLRGMPVGQWIVEKSHAPIVGSWLADRSTGWLISYAGIVFDLCIVPLLLWKPTRKLAFAAAATFHVTNAFLFEIDVFPWMMILATPVFFAPNWPRRILRLSSPATIGRNVVSRTFNQRLMIGFCAFYVVCQLLLPLRHFLYPGDASWTEEGQLFAWRMMLRRKDVFLRIYATDGTSGKVVKVPVIPGMSIEQLKEMAVSPSQLVACAPFFAEKARAMGLREVEIRAVVLTSLNGRKPQLQIDPDLDLLTVERSIWPQQGIVPLTEPLRAEPWDVPTKRWPEAIGFELPETQ